jgi:hypothetical protein
MATNPSNLTPEQIRLLQQQNDLYRKQLELQSEGYSLSTSYLESLKEIMGIRSRISVSDGNILDLNKKINREILSQKSGFDRVVDVQKQIVKNSDLLRKSRVQELSLLNEISNKDKNRLNQVGVYLDKTTKLQKEIDIELSKSKEERDLNKELIDGLIKQKDVLDSMINSRIENMSGSAKTLLYTQKQTQELEKQQKLAEKEKSYLTEREKSLGLTGKLTRALSDIPGLSHIFGDPAYLEEVNSKIDAIYVKTGKFPGLFKTLGIQIGTAGKMLAKSLMDPLVYLGLMIKGFLSLDKAQTDFQRETGKTVNHMDTINTSLISSSDYIKQASELTKELGMNAQAIFTPKTLQEAAELTNLIGLSADESNRLAILSKASGKELLTTDQNIVKMVDHFNKSNKTAISAKAVLQDVAKVSNAIAITFGNNPEKIAAAAAEARKLGLTLEGVNATADSLLNFESSINNEISAELITGQKLNLDKARLLSLNDDIAGLTKEIGTNEGIINGFTKGNRIQRQAIADAIGMSKEDLAKMVMTQKIQQGLSGQALADATGMSLEDIKRLDMQDSITKSIEKMGEALAGPLEMLSGMLSTLSKFSTLIEVVIGSLLVYKGIQLTLLTWEGIKLGMQQQQIVAQYGSNTLALARQTILSGELAKTIGIAAAWTIANWPSALIGLGIAAGVGTLVYSQMKDGEMDYKKGPIVSGGFGSVQLHPKDTGYFNGEKIVAGTNLGGGNKSQSQAAPSAYMDPSLLLNEIKGLRQDQARSNQKPIAVAYSINGTEFSNSLHKYAYKTS